MSPGGRTLLSMAGASHTEGLPSSSGRSRRLDPLPATSKVQRPSHWAAAGGPERLGGPGTAPFPSSLSRPRSGCGWVRSVLRVGGLRSVVGTTLCVNNDHTDTSFSFLIFLKQAFDSRVIVILIIEIRPNSATLGHVRAIDRCSSRPTVCTERATDIYLGFQNSLSTLIAFLNRY